MPKLITRCLSEDYETVTENHDDMDRGELDSDKFSNALHFASYTMPINADPNSPHRPAVGVIISGQVRPTFFYASDYQGGFSLGPNDRNEFKADDIIDLVNGDKSIEEIRENNIVSDKKMTRGVYAVLGFILLIILYFLAAPHFG